MHWFYEKDVLNEDSVIEWFETLTQASRLRTKIQPFVQWLQEADEESGSEEGSD